MRKLKHRYVLVFVLACACLLFAHSQQPAQPQQADDIPVIDGGIGPCSVAFTVTDADAKPVYAATVKVHITYGFGGFRKMDLEASTNAQGKVTFKGLPAKPHNPPLEFHASKDQLVGMATDDPVTECKAKHDIVLEKPKPATSTKQLAISNWQLAQAQGIVGFDKLPSVCHSERSASKGHAPRKSGARSRGIPRDHPWACCLRLFSLDLSPSSLTGAIDAPLKNPSPVLQE
ncbi:MAG TPA: hypothetical protein VKL40_14025 [Candidatus Angelobacter sp.]|nr:hypothetical protein [Candidatus Angelobacter sp.]